MRRPLMLATTVATAGLLVLGACSRAAEDRDDAEAAMTTPAADGSAADREALPPAGAAQGFLARASIIDLFEIESARLALERTQTADVRRFAQMMIDDHTRLGQEAQALATAQQVPLPAPARLDGARQEMLNGLRDIRPDDFDARYVEQQVEAHENALQLMREYADSGDNPALQDWARRTAPAIENHLQMARALDRGAAPAGAATAPGQ